MTRTELCDLVCDCLETLGTFPGDRSCRTTLPDLTDDQKEQLAFCIVSRGQERGCSVILGPENMNPGMTVDDLCAVIESGMECD